MKCKDEFSFIEKWCSPLTPEQYDATMFSVNNGSFVGVARPVGSMKWFPMIETDGRSGPYVINEEGNYTLASKEGMRFF